MTSTIETARLDRRTLMKQAGIFGLGLPAAAMLINACSTDNDSDATQAVNTGGLVITPPAASPEAGHGHDVSSQATTELTIAAQDLSSYRRR